MHQAVAVKSVLVPGSAPYEGVGLIGEGAMVANVTRAFARNRDLLSKCRKGGTAKGAALLAARKEYRISTCELQPLGEWSMAQVRNMLERVREAVQLPLGYATRMTSEGTPFIGNDINTPDNISLYMEKRDADLAEVDQFSVEVRVFLDQPRVMVFFRVGNQYAFEGRRVDVFMGSPRAMSSTYSELADMTIDALKQAIKAEGFC